jgi:hypothetical protein
MSELERLREEAEAEMRRKAPRYALDSPTLHDPLARRLRRLEPRPSASRPISLTADAPAADPPSPQDPGRRGRPREAPQDRPHRG